MGIILPGKSYSDYFSNLAAALPETEREELNIEGVLNLQIKEVSRQGRSWDDPEKPGRPYLRLYGSATHIIGDFPYNVEALSLDGENQNFRIIYEFSDDELSEMVSAGIFEKDFKIPEDLSRAQNYQIPISLDIQMVHPELEGQLPVFFYNIKSHSLSSSAQTGYYRLAGLFDTEKDAGEMEIVNELSGLNLDTDYALIDELGDIDLDFGDKGVEEELNLDEIFGREAEAAKLEREKAAEAEAEAEAELLAEDDLELDDDLNLDFEDEDELDNDLNLDFEDEEEEEFAGLDFEEDNDLGLDLAELEIDLDDVDLDTPFGYEDEDELDDDLNVAGVELGEVADFEPTPDPLEDDLNLDELLEKETQSRREKVMREIEAEADADAVVERVAVTHQSEDIAKEALDIEKQARNLERRLAALRARGAAANMGNVDLNPVVDAVQVAPVASKREKVVFDDSKDKPASALRPLIIKDEPEAKVEAKPVETEKAAEVVPKVEEKQAAEPTQPVVRLKNNPLSLSDSITGGMERKPVEPTPFEPRRSMRDERRQNRLEQMQAERAAEQQKQVQERQEKMYESRQTAEALKKVRDARLDSQRKANARLATKINQYDIKYDEVAREYAEKGLEPPEKELGEDSVHDLEMD